MGTASRRGTKLEGEGDHVGGRRRSAGSISLVGISSKRMLALSVLEMGGSGCRGLLRRRGLLD